MGGCHAAVMARDGCRRHHVGAGGRCRAGVGGDRGRPDADLADQRPGPGHRLQRHDGVSGRHLHLGPPPWQSAGRGRGDAYRAAAFDTATGGLLSWNPNVNGEVRALAVAGQTVYLGGGFTTVGGLTRRRLAAVNASSGQPTSWNPNPSAKVNALATDGLTVWLGGTFTSVGGNSRLRLAAVSATTPRSPASAPTYPARPAGADPMSTPSL
jgi:hypothetical protein